MDRENLIPLVGLVALAVAGAVMLYATTGADPERPAPGKPERAEQAQKTKSKPRAPKLLQRGDVGDRPSAPEGAHNLVVVTGSAVRRDALGPYGGHAALTPRLNSLAAAGARFDDVVGAGVWTRESIAAMWTGKHAIDVDMVEPGPKASQKKLHPSHLTMAEVLRDAGWWTIGVNANPQITRPGSALWQGFDHTRDAHPQGLKTQFRLRNVPAAQQALQMVSERPADRPFYLQLVLSESHKPVRIPPGESKPWADQNLPNPAYMATIRRLDDSVGVLVDWLESEGLADSTYVVFLADCGEGLGRPEHHGPAHGRYLSPSAARIPWIVAGPGIPESRAVGGLASGVDVAPTLLGLLGRGEDLGAISGRDLSTALQSGQTGRDIAISDTWYTNANRAAIWTSSTQCQRDFGSTNLEDDGFVDGCFDRGSDPDFVTPIEDANLMARLETWRQERAERVAAPELE